MIRFLSNKQRMTVRCKAKKKSKICFDWDFFLFLQRELILIKCESLFLPSNSHRRDLIGGGGGGDQMKAAGIKEKQNNVIVLRLFEELFSSRRRGKREGAGQNRVKGTQNTSHHRNWWKMPATAIMSYVDNLLWIPHRPLLCHQTLSAHSIKQRPWCYWAK